MLVLPSQQILVLLKVVTVLIGEVKGRSNGLLHLVQSLQEAFVLVDLVLFSHVEHFILCRLLLCEAMLQIGHAELILLLDLVAVLKHRMTLLFGEEEVIEPLRVILDLLILAYSYQNASSDDVGEQILRIKGVDEH